MAKNYFYHAYGLNIKSSINFPELISGKSDFDVIIHSNGEESLFQNINTHKSGFSKILFTTNDILYFLDTNPIFRVRYGKEIIINPKVTMSMLFLRSLILGIGMGTLIMQRGNLVLHASSINIEGEAIAFVGQCGEGKSTIAAEMNNQDYMFVTDDILTVHIDEKITVFPSFPRAKLCDDAIKNMIDDSNLSPKIHPKVGKYFYNVRNNFSIKPVPLKVIYILENAGQNQIVPLKSQESLIELIRNSYAINLLGDSEKSQNLFQCARLVKDIPIKRLMKINSLDKLEELIQLVEKDVLN